MDLRGSTFGAGHREIGGAVDLINQYKLLPYHELFCRKSLPLTITETRYLHNVVGDREIKKGEGMEFDQLCRKTSYLTESHPSICPFELGALVEAFKLKETAPIGLHSAEKGILKVESKERQRKHKKERGKEKKHKKHKLLNEDISNLKDLKRRIETGPENLQKQQKKRRDDGM